MIPISLQLKNFLSYGAAQTIHFGTHRLICLSGKNGHGKSALLDAMTWALWGQARKVSGTVKADEGLLRLGQTHMMVCFDFSFDNHTYRAKREFTLATGKQYTTLDFGLLDQTTEKFIPLTDKTMRATQTVIDGTIGLNYDSFINSVFLRQGQSNEFSKKSPKERKEIIATILELHRFEQLRKQAFEKIRKITEERETVRALHDRIIQELEQSTQMTHQLTTINNQLAHQLQEEQILYRRQTDLMQEKAAYTQQQHQLDMISFQLTAKEQEFSTLLAKMVSIRTTWKEVHSKNLHAPDIQLLETEKSALTIELNTQQLTLQKTLTLKEQFLGCREQGQTLLKQLHDQETVKLNEKQQAIERLQQTIYLHEQRSQETRQQLQQLIKEQETVVTERAQFEQLLKQMPALEQQLVMHEKKFEKRKNYYQRYITQGNWVKTELEQLVQKQKLTNHEDNPSCPLCEQNLSASRRRFLKTKFSKQEQFLIHRLQRLTTIITNLKAVLIEQHEQINQQKISVAQLQRTHHQYEQTGIAHTKAQQKSAELTTQHTQLTDLIAQTKIAFEKAHHALNAQKQQSLECINQNTTHQAIIKQQKQLEHDLQELSYNATVHQQLSTRAQTLDAALKAHQQLKEALMFQQQRARHIHEQIVQLKKIKQEKSALLAQRVQFNHLTQLHARLHKEETELVSVLKKSVQEKEQILQEKGKIENQKQQLLQREKELQQYKHTITSCNQALEEYQAIATALSKDGIQALLIEEAIPGIEHEANQLLAKLTDNQAQLFIESVRDLKKGGFKETLDINISDSVGIRPYELFSGGEAFRIDFALRIAISKLLARRAGTSLQTLIIDEGFGSQDEEGLSHIMDALYKIQDDFAKIIIVSHLPAMKDQFPVHFIVEKGAQGSTVTVLEQG